MEHIKQLPVLILCPTLTQLFWGFSKATPNPFAASSLDYLPPILSKKYIWVNPVSDIDPTLIIIIRKLLEQVS
jgi:hypothetical protein